MFVEMPIEERVPFLETMSVLEDNSSFFYNDQPKAFVYQSNQACPATYAQQTTGGGFGGFSQTTFQNEFVDNEMTFTSMETCSQESLKKVEDMVFEEVTKDIDVTCSTLGIPKDPLMWAVEHVQRWISATLHRYNLPTSAAQFFVLNGVNLCGLCEQDFVSRTPSCGSTLYAELDIWRNASSLSQTKKEPLTPLTPVSPLWTGPPAWSEMYNGPSHQYHNMGATGCQTMFSTPPPPISPTPSESSLDSSLSTESEYLPESGSPAASGGKRRRTKQTIHLWQFLRELLDTTGMEKTIRWIERETGIFKIEDSTTVSQLWGKRKNRPAMNYDKLSRSVRQYYKKGIMKKTEDSKRLVYQFCEPYV